MDDLEEDVLNIGLDDSPESAESAPPSPKPKKPRDYQSHEDWLVQKKAYIAKVEMGDNYESLLTLPVDQPNKMQSQSILHAAEELYFFGKYQQALDIVEAALKGDLEKNYRAELDDYRDRCKTKLGSKAV